MSDERNLDKALDIVARLMTGEEITAKENTALYESYQGSTEVHNLTRDILKRLNLCLYEYQDGLYVSAGENNKVFGYTNEELKKAFGVKLNKELFLCYFIIYHIMMAFYTDTMSSTFAEFVRIEDIIAGVDKTVAGLVNTTEGLLSEENEGDGFKAVALLWDSLDTVGGGEEAVVRSAKNSRRGYVKMVFNFLAGQQLFVEMEGRYYPSNRFKALMENYFDEYKGSLYRLMERKGTEENAAD